MKLTLTISGAPRTKKNHGVMLKHSKRGRVTLPSKAWREWVRLAHICESDTGHLFYGDRDTLYVGHFPVATLWVPLCDPMNARAIFYRDALRGDAVGFYQGLADLLETRGIVTDDKHFVSWDGSRLELDRENPRVEVELSPA